MKLPLSQRCLLAGLLDNTSGLSHGVNGTFQEVTSYTESLNLLPSVLSAIPNAAIGGDGLYGAPVSVPPPPTSSAWGSFWNAVTSVVENPLGAIVSPATIVWSATVAATTYLDHLAHEALAIGGELLARAAAVLVEVGQVLAKALLLLLQFILSMIEAMFHPLVQLIVGAMTSFAEGVDAAVDPTGAAAVWGSVGSPLFMAGFAVAALAEVASTLLTAVTAGAAAYLESFITGQIVGLIITLVSLILSVTSEMSTTLVSNCESLAGVYYDQSTVTPE